MYWRSGIVLMLLASNALAVDGYIIGVGVEGDSADGLSTVAMTDIAIAKDTWLSAAVARNTVDLSRAESLDSWYGDLGIDHWFDPVGLRVGVSYWGDSDTLDSKDWRSSIYWRSDKAMIAGDYEYRDFRFDLPATDFFPGRIARFDANGVGLTTRFNLTPKTSISLHGMDYDYSVNLRLAQNSGILDLLSFSRLSLINSLVDHRVGMTLGVEAAKQYWRLDLSSTRGEADGGTTTSATLRLLTPMGKGSDVEFSLGVDDSDLYGNVTFLSVFLYFYGGR
jgi:hypothetical protein